MRIFLITGASIGVVGTLVGFTVGLVVCRHIEAIRQLLSWLTGKQLFPPELYFLSELPAEVDVVETATVVIMAADAGVPRNALSIVARCAARSGRGLPADAD